MKQKNKFGFGAGGFFNQNADPKNPHIMGAGNLPGGCYDSLTIAGAGKVDGNVEAGTIRCSGSATIDGNVKATDFQANGSSTVSGNIVAETIAVSGAMHAGGYVHAQSFSARGAFNIGDDVEAKTFSAHGGFGVDGSIKADEVEIELNDRASAKAIAAKTVSVKRGASAGATGVSGGSADASATATARGGIAIGGSGGIAIGGSVSGGSSNQERVLEVDTIEADDIALEATHAKLVKGKRVEIGPECRIDRVVYSETIAVDKDAAVTKQEKSS